jgi:hypothetical protein
MMKEQPMRRQGSWACLFQVCRGREAWIVSGLRVDGVRSGVRRARKERELLRDVLARLVLVARESA